MENPGTKFVKMPMLQVVFYYYYYYYWPCDHEAVIKSAVKVPLMLRESQQSRRYENVKKHAELVKLFKGTFILFLLLYSPNLALRSRPGSSCNFIGTEEQSATKQKLH